MFGVLCLASDNVDISWDELNSDDLEVQRFEGDTRCDSSPIWMKTSQ